MKIQLEMQPLDLMATSTTQVEIQPEVGWKDKFKLYIHQDGVTIIRMCKLSASQINLTLGPITQKHENTPKHSIS